MDMTSLRWSICLTSTNIIMTSLAGCARNAIMENADVEFDIVVPHRVQNELNVQENVREL